MSRRHINKSHKRKVIDYNDDDDNDDILGWVAKKSGQTVTINEELDSDIDSDINDETEDIPINVAESKTNTSNTWFLKYLAVLGAIVITIIIVFWIVNIPNRKLLSGLKKGEALLYVSSPEYSVGADTGGI